VNREGIALAMPPPTSDSDANVEPGPQAGATGTPPPGQPPSGAPAPGAQPNTVEPIKQYLVAVPGAVNKINQADFDPAAVQTNASIGQAFQSAARLRFEDTGIRLLAALEGPQSPTGQSDPAVPQAQDTIFVAQFTDQGLEAFQQNFKTAVVAEDIPLDLARAATAPAAPPPGSTAPPGGGPATPQARPISVTVPDPSLSPVVALEDALNVNITVRGGGAPLANANVYLIGSVFPAQGVTDAQGNVSMTIYGERTDTIRVLMVRPKSDFWSRVIQRPRLVDAPGTNDVEVFPISQQPQEHGFPDQKVLGWGQSAMGLDKIPDTMRGSGVKVAVVDSGVQKDHPNLQVAAGSDIVAVVAGQSDTGGWGQDSVGHGSHCAGVIAARDINRGIRGFAPEAEVHSLKIFPGAQISHLVQALNYCISNTIDVANMSLGVAQLSPEQRQLLEGKIQQAKAAGVACIVAAGNSATAVQYPGALPDVLPVAALGQFGTFPDDSSHAGQVFGDGVAGADPNAFFSAKFTCFGPEVATRGVAAPGVAVLSTVPNTNYAVMDGTSMAAPHVAGLAALLVAHHPSLKGQPRNAQRVELLFDLIRQSSRSLGWPAERQGAGLPSAQRALAPGQAGAPAGGTTQPAGAGSNGAGTGVRTPDRQRFEDDFPAFKQLGAPGPTATELRSLQVELEELQRLEQRLNVVVASLPTAPVQKSPALQQLNILMQSVGLLPSGASSASNPGPTTSSGTLATAGAGSNAPGALGGVEPQFLEGFLRDQVYDVIQKLYRYVRQHGELAECAPMVTTTVQQFGQGQYTKALASGYQAFNCMQARLR
jgi:subtilisin